MLTNMVQVIAKFYNNIFIILCDVIAAEKSFASQNPNRHVYFSNTKRYTKKGDYTDTTILS